MLFYLLACYCLDLTQQKWLIVSKTNSSAYLQLKDGKFSILKDVFPLNYDDDRVVTFIAKNPADYKRKLERQKIQPTEEPLTENVFFTISFNQGKLCKLNKFKNVAPCDGPSNKESLWRIDENSNGFKIITGDMCLRLTTTDSKLYAKTLSVGLDECDDDPTFYWNIEIMPRNFSLPEDIDEKYQIFVPKHKGKNGEEINGHNIFHYGKYKKHAKYD
ncbi:hypothetical protein THOM_1853 [Trachipleistophora hominis]|uniref:Uncharacterized protein n=1 Tax=Trachipleistophora hominis TaxID=72359 RepID=L7JVB1_TRAHO|nr:hypothetical protein THOM_1853 [Trachipleistophora hominis]